MLLEKVVKKLAVTWLKFKYLGWRSWCPYIAVVHQFGERGRFLRKGEKIIMMKLPGVKFVSTFRGWFFWGKYFACLASSCLWGGNCILTIWPMGRSWNANPPDVYNRGKWRSRVFHNVCLKIGGLHHPSFPLKMDRLKRGLVTSTVWMISPRYTIPEVNRDMPTGKGKVHSTTQILGENLSIWNVCTFSYPRIQCEDVFQGENITFGGNDVFHFHVFPTVCFSLQKYHSFY